jgi:hypothetical protein
MPIFTYECHAGHRWDERRDRNDPMLGLSLDVCPVDGCEETDICGCCEYQSIGTRVFAPTTTVYYHGMGWAAKDRYWEKINASEQ